MLTSVQHFIALPGHPLYGQPVGVITYHTIKREIYALLEDPTHPGFHYQIQATWLSITPPLPEKDPIPEQEPIALSLVALDKMVQTIMNKNHLWRTDENDYANTPNERSDLGTASPGEEGATGNPAFLFGPEADRRDTP